MKLMGMRGYLHWLAWMFKFSTAMTISCILITGIFFIPTQYGAIINHSDPFTIFLFVYLYGLAVITFGFAVSAFFAHSNYPRSLLFSERYCDHFYVCLSVCHTREL